MRSVVLCAEEQRERLLRGLRNVPGDHSVLVTSHHHLCCIDGGHEVDQCRHWRGNLREESKGGGRRGWREEKRGEVPRRKKGGGRQREMREGKRKENWMEAEERVSWWIRREKRRREKRG